VNRDEGHDENEHHDDVKDELSVSPGDGKGTGGDDVDRAEEEDVPEILRRGGGVHFCIEAQNTSAGQ